MGCGIIFLHLMLLAVTVRGQDGWCTAECSKDCSTNGLTLYGSGGKIVNVAYGKSSNISSGSYNPSCMAVNGRTSTAPSQIGQMNSNCVISGYGDYKAYWKVDLGRLYTITNITIYKQKESTRRMSGLSVLVENQTCYSFPDRTTSLSALSELDTLPEQIDISCNSPLTGQNVWLQKHGEERNSNFYTIGVCEVQVWVCRDGLFGKNCAQECSGNCKGEVPCDNYHGICHEGCMDGYTGADCRCGHCKANVTCDVTSRTCPTGCEEGWYTPFCNQKSPGPTCDYPCRHHCNTTGMTLEGSRNKIVNIAYGKPAEVSSAYDYGRFDRGVSGPGCLAVNGKTSIYRTPLQGNANCFLTARYDFAPWWWVDLGRQYTITNITLFTFNDDYAYVARESVLVENKEANQTCYSFLNDQAVLAGRLRYDITCSSPLTGQKVWIQKDGEDRYGSNFFFFACEVQVWACRDGLFGETCTQQCRGHCKDDVPCDNYYGICHEGCKEGYTGADCRCGHCKANATCDVTNMTCPSGCDEGWLTPYCNQSCPAGRYGDECREECGQCSGGVTCNKETGACPYGCQSETTGEFCKQAVSVSEASVGVIVGACVAGLVVLVIIAAVVFVFIRRSRLRSASRNPTSSTAPSQETETGVLFWLRSRLRSPPRDPTSPKGPGQEIGFPSMVAAVRSPHHSLPPVPLEEPEESPYDFINEGFKRDNFYDPIRAPSADTTTYTYSGLAGTY